MKRLFFALVGTAILLMAFQCGKDYAEPAVGSNNAHHSACLSHTDASAKGFENDDSVSVAYNNGTVHVIHHNLAVNCGTAEMEGGINVTCMRNGSTIDIYELEDEDNPQANCMCDVDNEFDLYSIEPGTYTFVFHSCYSDSLSAIFSF